MVRQGTLNPSTWVRFPPGSYYITGCDMASDITSKIREVLDNMSTFPDMQSFMYELRRVSNHIVDDAYDEVQQIYKQLENKDSATLIRNLKAFDIPIVLKLLNLVNCLATIDETDAVITYGAIGDFISHPESKMLQKVMLYIARKYKDKEKYPDLEMYMQAISQVVLDGWGQLQI